MSVLRRSSSGFLSDTISLNKSHVDIFPKSFLKTGVKLPFCPFCGPLVQWFWGEWEWEGSCSTDESWLNQSTLWLQGPKIPSTPNHAALALLNVARHHFLSWGLPVSWLQQAATHAANNGSVTPHRDVFPTNTPTYFFLSCWLLWVASTPLMP